MLYLRLLTSLFSKSAINFDSQRKIAINAEFALGYGTHIQPCLTFGTGVSIHPYCLANQHDIRTPMFAS